MWLIPLRDQMSGEQWLAWNDIQRAALALVRDGDPNDLWLFHGTAAVQAGWVLREGFHPAHLHGGLGRGFPVDVGVYWGHPLVAASFAERWAGSDNLPVLFAARASSVARSTPDNLLRPDHFACAEAGCPRSYPDGMGWDSPDIPSYELGPEASLDGLQGSEAGGIVPDNWRQSLAASGAVTAPDGRHVPDLALLAISDRLPAHPGAAGRRAERLAARPQGWERKYGAFVPPGMERSMDPLSTEGARKVLSLADIAHSHAPEQMTEFGRR